MKAETLRDFRYQLAELKIKWWSHQKFGWLPQSRSQKY
jgi:hypothetical protein